MQLSCGLSQSGPRARKPDDLYTYAGGKIGHRRRLRDRCQSQAQRPTGASERSTRGHLICGGHWVAANTDAVWGRRHGRTWGGRYHCAKASAGCGEKPARPFAGPSHFQNRSVDDQYRNQQLLQTGAHWVAVFVAQNWADDYGRQSWYRVFEN